jgi:hypothetical protein
MRKGNDGWEVNPLNNISNADYNKRKVRGVGDLAEKLGYWYSTRRAFSPQFIDEHGLVLGEYNVYMNPVDSNNFRCEIPGCEEILQEIYVRIVTVMDKDAEWYTLASLAKDTAVYEALISTNERVVRCLRHKAPGIPVSQKSEMISATVTPIAEGKSIRGKLRKIREFDRHKLT